MCSSQRYFTVKQHYFDSNVIKKEKVKHRLHVETFFMEPKSCMTIDLVACLKTLFYGTIWSFTKLKFGYHVLFHTIFMKLFSIYQ